jgi:CheY-like chemotaxis protein
MSLSDLDNKCVLVVEDDDMSFLYLNQLLMLSNAVITREKSGVDALERFRGNQAFDMILMDIQLPDMDGKQVTRDIRNLDKQVPIIAQTADKSPVERELAMEAGCTDLITKPFSPEEFFTVISKHLSH